MQPPPQGLPATAPVDDPVAAARLAKLIQRAAEADAKVAHAKVAAAVVAANADAHRRATAPAPGARDEEMSESEFGCTGCRVWDVAVTLLDVNADPVAAACVVYCA